MFVGWRCGEEVPSPADLDNNNPDETEHYRLDHQFNGRASEP
jgi:hypothetical protein